MYDLDTGDKGWFKKPLWLLGAVWGRGGTKDEEDRVMKLVIGRAWCSGLMVRTDFLKGRIV